MLASLVWRTMTVLNSMSLLGAISLIRDRTFKTSLACHAVNLSFLPPTLVIDGLIAPLNGRKSMGFPGSISPRNSGVINLLLTMGPSCWAWIYSSPNDSAGSIGRFSPQVPCTETEKTFCQPKNPLRHSNCLRLDETFTQKLGFA